MWLLRSINLKVNFIHPGLRYRVIKLLCRLLGFSSQKFEVDFYGYRYEGNLRNQIDFMVFFFGAYEIGILNYVKKFITKDSIVLDIGANIGHHSLYFSSLCKQVYAFEPYEAVRKKLESKIERNGIKNITVVPVGLSNEASELAYFEPPSSNLGSGSFLAAHSNENLNQGLKLELKNGDAVVNNMSLQKIDFVKIDVEGFEYFVLKGLVDTLRLQRPVLMLEFNKSTRSHCGSFEEFKKLFPENYTFLKLNKQFRTQVETEKFEYYKEVTANIICMPNM